jgi:hypothetical protein
MKSFYTNNTQGTKRKRSGTGEGAGARGGAGGIGAADCEEFRAHGYEVRWKKRKTLWKIAVSHMSHFSRCGSLPSQATT